MKTTKQALFTRDAVLRQALPVAITSVMLSSFIPFTEAIEDDYQAEIVGGKEAIPYSRPYQVALLMNGRQGCGGTLISPNWVLTAAHCLDNAYPSAMTVRVGAHSLSRNDGQTIQVSQIIVHENWYGANNIRSGYDIGLLKLSSPASSQYQPAKLPTATIEQQYAGIGDAVTVSGWGLTYHRGQQSDVLREVNLPVISNSSCSQRLNFNIPSSVICGGGQGGVSACNGDSGGPYAANVNGTYYNFGIVSWGINCQGATAFTRVSSYVDWIKQKTGIGDGGGNPGSGPVADFSYSVSGMTISFNNESRDDGGIVRSEWDFGDGNRSSEGSPQHTYRQNGSYTVSLKVTGEDGKVGTSSKTVEVGDSGTPGCGNLPTWDFMTYYYAGDRIIWMGYQFEAMEFSFSADPLVYSNVWRNLGSCGNRGWKQ